MTLQQLRDFVASVEHGSLRRAAHAEGKSEASLSKSIKRLEISVGTELLRRGALGISLTEAGKVLLARAQLILSEVELAQLEVSPGGRDNARSRSARLRSPGFYSRPPPCANSDIATAEWSSVAQVVRIPDSCRSC